MEVAPVRRPGTGIRHDGRTPNPQTSKSIVHPNERPFSAHAEPPPPPFHAEISSHFVAAVGGKKCSWPVTRVAR